LRKGYVRGETEREVTRYKKKKRGVSKRDFLLARPESPTG